MSFSKLLMDSKEDSRSSICIGLDLAVYESRKEKTLQIDEEKTEVENTEEIIIEEKTPPVQEQIEPEKNEEKIKEVEPEIEQPVPAKTDDQPADSDGDGLSDKEEALLGTNINNADSDNDGLYDREEVKVYKTDPLNPDTDGDSYFDGSEVNDGYNPKGAGKLYEID